MRTTQSRNRLAYQSMMAALRLRREAGLQFEEPLCVYDLAIELGIDVRFFNIPSMEGVYSRDESPKIIISSLRPPGRQAFTCAHELGHYILGHGTRYDELVEQRLSARESDPHEFQADCFAGTLLMPHAAVRHGFKVRGWQPHACSPIAFYTVSNWLGVGYASLIHHMQFALAMIDPGRAEWLKRFQPKELRASILKRESRENLIVIDEHWQRSPVDAQVSDILISPPNTRFDGIILETLEETYHRGVFRATQPGTGRIHNDALSWTTQVRVSRKNYAGRACYRFQEEVSDDD
ncbi:ImmA/IrrE family metallo-endopeptidase [Candidatus Sumerlaeota bacterium]|nr:ImmA/IrrE family metallo-endopeptidase [Candidatus Sumerlaeota bacterium]